MVLQREECEHEPNRPVPYLYHPDYHVSCGKTLYMATKTNASLCIKQKTPFKMKLGRKPNLGHIHEFGVAAYVKDLKARKLDPRALVS